MKQLFLPSSERSGLPSSIGFFTASFAIREVVMPKIFKLSIFVTAMIVLVSGSAWAHSVVVFAWVEGDTVYVEGKFGSGRKVVDSPVEVYDSQGNLLLTGTTDKNGEFSFKARRKSEMKVVLLAGMGHRGEWTIPASDFDTAGSGEVIGAESSGPRQIAASGSVSAEEVVAGTDTPRVSPGYVTGTEMQAAIEAALDKKLKPMMKLLVDEKQSGPSMTEIMGGIGYIFGLVGVVAYMASRRKKSL